MMLQTISSVSVMVLLLAFITGVQALPTLLMKTV
jgi:hypothetical protein